MAACGMFMFRLRFSCWALGIDSIIFEEYVLALYDLNESGVPVVTADGRPHVQFRSLLSESRT